MILLFILLTLLSQSGARVQPCFMETPVPTSSLDERHVTAIHDWKFRDREGKHSRRRKKKLYSHVVARTKWEVICIFSQKRKLSHRKRWTNWRDDGNTACLSSLKSQLETWCNSAMSRKTKHFVWVAGALFAALASGAGTATNNVAMNAVLNDVPETNPVCVRCNMAD